MVPLIKTVRLSSESVASLLSEKYFASIIVIVSFAISDGCTVIGPMDIHLCAPLPTNPTASVSTRSASVKAYALKVCFFISFTFMRDTHSIATAPNISHMLCLFTKYRPSSYLNAAYAYPAENTMTDPYIASSTTSKRKRESKLLLSLGSSLTIVALVFCISVYII